MSGAREEFLAEEWVALGDALTSCMDEVGLLQKELAAHANVSPALIRDIQRYSSKHRHSPRTLEALSRGVDRPPDYFSRIFDGTLIHTPRNQDKAEQLTDQEVLLSVQRIQQVLQQCMEELSKLTPYLRVRFDISYPKTPSTSETSSEVSIDKRHQGDQ